MRAVTLSLTGMAILAFLFAADSQVERQGQREEQHSCTQCHSLRIIDSQRLSRSGWEKEIDKMMRWGAPVSDRQRLLDYLAGTYSDSKPIAAEEYTADGTGAKKH
jgi:hypothetical protein